MAELELKSVGDFCDWAWDVLPRPKAKAIIRQDLTENVYQFSARLKAEHYEVWLAFHAAKRVLGE